MTWLVRILILLFVLPILWPLLRYAWQHRPMDDKTLFETRCSACHALPSLARSRDWDWGAVVATMRYLNGADAVISDEEAMRITDYLMEQHERRWQGRGDDDAS